MGHALLAINAGSSSIRFAIYAEGHPLRWVLGGIVDRVGLSGANLTCSDPDGNPQESCAIDSTDHDSTVASLLDWLEAQPLFASVEAVGHRVVHGMTHSEPERVTPELLAELHCIEPSDPEHLPLEIELMEAFRERHPALPQVACFDTAFHRTLPRIARLLAIPRRYEAQGVQRYGFHGLSYAYLMEELTRLGDPAATTGRLLLAHLGNGASMAAYLHVLADALTSLLAIVALSAGKSLGWMWMDPVMGIVGSLVIGRWSLDLLRQTSSVLLDGEIGLEQREAIRSLIEADRDNRVADLHVWRVGPRHLGAIVTAVTHEPQAPDHYKALLSERPDLVHLTVEVHSCPEEQAA